MFIILQILFASYKNRSFQNIQQHLQKNISKFLKTRSKYPDPEKNQNIFVCIQIFIFCANNLSKTSESYFVINMHAKN